MKMEGHGGSRVLYEEPGGSQWTDTQNDKAKASAIKPVASKIDEPSSKMPLRKKVNRKTPAKNKAENYETRKKPHEGSKDRLEENETDESSSDDKYLEDYSTGDSDFDISDSDDLSQEFSDEDKLMEYYERKLREHCLVGNVGSCSTDSNADGGSPDELEKLSSNQSQKTDVVNQSDPHKDSKKDSQPKTAAKTVKRTKPVGGRNQNSKSHLTAPSNNRKDRIPPECNRTRAAKFEHSQFYNDNDSYDTSDAVDTGPQSANDFGEPSSSYVSAPMMGSRHPEKSSPSVNADRYESNRKVMDYLNRMEESGPSEKREMRNKEKRASYQSIVEEIHNSAKDHILKNYVSSFAQKGDFGTRKRNVRKHNYSTSSSTASESGQSGNEPTKDEVVDRILTSSLSGNTERNLTNLMDLWKSTLSK